MEIVQMAARRLAAKRVTGPYGQGYEPVCEALWQWCQQQGVSGEWLFVCCDNPELTAPEQCRTDIGVTITEGQPLDDTVMEVRLEAGAYAVRRTIIHNKSEYPQQWQALLAEVKAAGLHWGDRPAYELYHDYDMVTGRADVSFCLPVVEAI